MSRSARMAFGLAMVGLAAWVNACKDSPPGLDEDDGEPIVAEATISEPIPAAAAALAARGGHILRSTMAAAGPDADVAYITLPSRTQPTADLAVITNPGHAGSVTVAVRDGGFDPVPVVASPGDDVNIQFIRMGTGSIGSTSLRVPLSRRPRVVRANPPRKQKDVPLNKHIVVVFSEPIAPASLTTSTFRVRRGTRDVPGTVRLIDGSGLTAAFLPSAPLARNADYTVDVTGVRDIQGDDLGGTFRSPFRTGTTTTGPVAAVRMSVDSLRLATRTYQLSAVVEDAAGNILADQTIVWESEDPTGVSVSQTGLVTALREGEYDVIARVGDVRSRTVVIVRSPEPPATITLDPPTATVIAEDTIVLTSDLRDASGRRLLRDVSWTTSDPALATVAPDFANSVQIGRVIAKAPGEVTITATSGTVSGTSTITITPPRPVASITLAPGSADLVVNGTVLLKPTLRAADGRLIVSRPITWHSTNTAVATVDATGLVTALAAGTTDVIATAEGVSDTVSVTVGAVGQFSSVTAGYGATCALDSSGKAYCWGSLFRAPGNPLPVSVATDVPLTSLTLGTWHTCGLDAGGTAYCWGLNSSQGLGSVAIGFLGTGSTADVVTTPEPVTGGLTFASISAGLYFTCGVTPAGAAYCWGSNSHGQLGNGKVSGNGATGEDRLTPTPVLGGLTFASISAGRGGTCGVTTAGAGYCWGSNNGGQLGNGSTESNSAVPVPVSGGLTFRTIITGGTLDSFGGFACGLTTAGAAYCWGDNAYGQTGSVGFSRVPVPVSGGLTFSSLAVGETHTCGLATTGAAWCWGDRRLGRLGDGGPETPQVNPVPVAVSGGLSFIQLSAGGGVGHTCGMTSGRVAWCWGDGRIGQLGHGLMTSSNVPVKVAGQP